MKIIFFLFSVMLVSCVTVPPMMTTPDGFARFDREKNFRAASADGVSVVSYIVESKSIGEDNPLATWVKEADRVLVAKGYALLSASQIPVKNGQQGTCLEYEVIFNAEPWIYAAFVVKGSNGLFIAEASGEKDVYLKRKDRIVESFKTIEIK